MTGFCKREQLEADIDESVCRLSKISILASFNLHHRVYDAIVYRDDNQWLEEFFNGEQPNIRAFHDEVKATRRLEQPRLEFSRIILRFGIDFVDASNLRNILRYQHALYLTIGELGELIPRAKTISTMVYASKRPKKQST